MRQFLTSAVTALAVLAASPVWACPRPTTPARQCAEPLAIINDGRDFTIMRRSAIHTLPRPAAQLTDMHKIGASVWLDADIADNAPLPDALSHAQHSILPAPLKERGQ